MLLSIDGVEVHDVAANRMTTYSAGEPSNVVDNKTVVEEKTDLAMSLMTMLV